MLPKFAERDFAMAMSQFVPLVGEDDIVAEDVASPPVVPEFWQADEAVSRVAALAVEYGLKPQEALLPAAWSIWLSRLTELEYSEQLQLARELSPDQPGWFDKAAQQLQRMPATFFWYLLAVPALNLSKRESALISLVKTEEAQPLRIGLLSVLPGECELSTGPAPLLWIGDESLVVQISGKDVDLKKEQGELFRVVREPIVMGRSTIREADADPCTTRLDSQLALLRSLDLAQSVNPPAGPRSPLCCWMRSPPAYVWVGSRDSAAFYFLATTVFGLSGIPATACFSNPSTQDICSVQAAIPSTRRPRLVMPSFGELAAVDFVLGVATRSAAVEDDAERLWWPGAVDLWSLDASAPPPHVLRPKADPAALRAGIIACGYEPELAALAVQRLLSLQPT